MFHGDGVPPGNILDGNADGRGQPLALGRSGRVVAADDGLHQLRIQSRGGDELLKAHSGLFHVACKRFHDSVNHIRKTGLRNHKDTKTRGLCLCVSVVPQSFLTANAAKDRLRDTRLKILRGGSVMRCKSVWTSAFGIALVAATLWAQVQPPPAPWRGAGPTPCVGADGGIIPCAPAARVVAIRAGRLFDSKTGQMLTRQVVLVQGERITDVGSEAQVRIPAGAQVIDFSQATVLPGLIDAHTHMFNTPRPGMSRETSTLIAIHNLQADLRAGFTAARDMSSHGNGYADIDIRNAINEGRIDGPRYQVSGRGIVWGGTAPSEAAVNPLASIAVRSVEEARAAVGEHIKRGADWIKLFPTGAYSFKATGEAQ